MKTFVSLSGGMDSTYLLWKLLSETSDEITTLFIDLTNLDLKTRLKYDIRSFSFEENTEENAAKVNAIANWLKTNVRDFTFVQEPISTEFLEKDANFPNNTTGYFARYAIPKINNGEFDRYCLSHEWENDGHTHGGTTGAVRRPGAWVAYELFIARAKRGSIQFTLLDMDYNQAYALSELPLELIDLVWDKRDTDAKSVKRHFFSGLLQEGKTPLEAGAVAKARCVLPNGKWHSMRSWVCGQEPNDGNTWDKPTWPSSYTVL
jgi:hypothetical protein